MPRWIFGSAATINLLEENAIQENAMHKLKALSVAVALLIATPVLAREMEGATGPGSTRGLEPTYNYGYYDDYGQRGEFSPGGVGGGVRALEGENSYAMGPDDDYCAQRYRSYDPTSGTHLGFDGRRHSCE